MESGSKLDFIFKPLLSVHDIIGEIQKHCDGTFSIDPHDWDLPQKAYEIIEPLIKLAKEKEQTLTNR